MVRCNTWKPAALVLLALLILGAPLQAQTVTITHLQYLPHGDGWKAYVEEMAEEFMRLHPDVKIDFIAAGSADYRDKMYVMAAAGTPADVTELTLSGATMAWEGYFLDLLPFVEKDPDVSLDMWPQPVVDGFTLDGMLWSLPADLAVWMNWYNADLFAEAGLLNPNELGEGWTWDAMVDAAKKLTVRDAEGNVLRYGIDRAHQYWQYGLVVTQSGGSFFDRPILPTESRMNSLEVKNALKFVADLFLVHQVTAPYGASNLSHYYFWTGRSAIDITDNPGIIGAYLKDVDFNWDVARPVAGPGGPGTNFTVGGFQIGAGTRHPDVAWEWVKFLTARSESVERFVALTGRLPSLLGVHDRYLDLVDHAPPSWWLMFEVAGAPTTIPTIVTQVPNTGHRNTIMPAVLRGERDPYSALDEAHALTQAAFDEFYGRK